MSVGGVDTYYDYDEHRWKFAASGAAPVRQPSMPVASCGVPTGLLSGDPR
jgi:hypothetical protein